MVAHGTGAANGRGRGFSEFYEESRSWPEGPASFKSWPEYEDKAASLRDWSPSILTGLLQAEDYARALISVQPHITQETTSARLTNRMQRQQQVMGRADPPAAWFTVDELSLYREVGGAAVMAAQLHHMLDVAARPKVTIQVLPAIAHRSMPAASSWPMMPSGSPSSRELPGQRVTGAHREAGRHMEGWRKSSYSDGNGGNCVEVAAASDVAVRDTADRGGATLTFSSGAWAEFIASLR